jgi:hypothetical protein
MSQDQQLSHFEHQRRFFSAANHASRRITDDALRVPTLTTEASAVRTTHRHGFHGPKRELQPFTRRFNGAGFAVWVRAARIMFHGIDPSPG